MIHHRSVKSRARCEAASRKPVGEVARGLSLFGGASSEVRRCNCSVVDESRSSLAGLAARCVSFYQTSIYLSIGVLKGPSRLQVVGVCFNLSIYLSIASAARGSSGGQGRASPLARLRPSHWHSQSARAHVHAIPPLEHAHVGTRASFGTRAAQLGTHRLRQPLRPGASWPPCLRQRWRRPTR